MRETGASGPSASAHGADADVGNAESRSRSPAGPPRRPPPARRTTRGGTRSSRRVRPERGQTTLDFAVGFGVFLVSLTFVVVFVPGMLQPFVGGTQAETPAANRVADDLAQRLLNDADEPYVLDADCTRNFFAGTAPADCPFDGATLQEQVGVLDRTYVNVTVRGNLTVGDGTRVLCWDDAGSGSVVERDATGCTPGSDGDVLFARGSAPSGSGGKTVSARRVASLAGHDVTIEVVMW